MRNTWSFVRQHHIAEWCTADECRAQVLEAVSKDGYELMNAADELRADREVRLKTRYL